MNALNELVGKLEQLAKEEPKKGLFLAELLERLGKYSNEDDPVDKALASFDPAIIEEMLVMPAFRSKWVGTNTAARLAVAGMTAQAGKTDDLATVKMKLKALRNAPRYAFVHSQAEDAFDAAMGRAKGPYSMEKLHQRIEVEIPSQRRLCDELFHMYFHEHGHTIMAEAFGGRGEIEINMRPMTNDEALYLSVQHVRCRAVFPGEQPDENDPTVKHRHAVIAAGGGIYERLGPLPQVATPYVEELLKRPMLWIELMQESTTASEDDPDVFGLCADGEQFFAACGDSVEKQLRAMKEALLHITPHVVKGEQRDKTLSLVCSSAFRHFGELTQLNQKLRMLMRDYEKAGEKDYIAETAEAVKENDNDE